MKKYKVIIFSFILAIGYSCSESSDVEIQRPGTNSIYATFEDGTGFFNPETPSPYGDTIKFVFSTHFPAESNNETNITRMSLKAYYPVSVVLPEGSEVVDLTRETKITIVKIDGTKKECIVKGVIRKSSEAQILEFNLPASNLPGFISEQRKIIGLVPGGIDIISQKPKLTLSPHSTIYPDTALIQDFSQPVSYVVTAEDGTKVTYTVKPVAPQKIASGIRKGSGRLLWSKSLGEMGIDNLNNMSTSIAISEKYLVVNTRAIKNKYFNRFNGNYEGEMPMATTMVGSLVNFAATSDDAGNILISSLAGNGAKLTVYKWNGVDDPAPVKFIEWTNNLGGSAGVGRKISVEGDLNGDALIFMGVSQKGNSYLRWQVIGGVLQSTDPVVNSYKETSKYWSYLADVAPMSLDITDNIFISGSPCEIVYTSATGSAEVIAKVDMSASGYGVNHSLDLLKFNNAPYLAAISINKDMLSGMSFLYDVTDPSKISTSPTSSEYADVCIYKTGAVQSNKNGNSTGEVLMKISDDGYKMILYTFVTNGGVNAYEFDCVNTDEL